MGRSYEYALSEVLLASATQIQAVLDGTSLRDTIARTPERLRAASQAHSFYTMRHLGLAQELRRIMVPKQPKDPLFNALLLQSILLVGAALGRDQGRDASAPLYTLHTVVDQAVEAAQSKPALRPSKGLLNAVLRRFDREHDNLMAQALKSPIARWNHPQWWINRLKKSYPHNWEEILTIANTPPPLSLRVNRRRCSVEQLLATFKEAGIEAWSPGNYTVVLAQPKPVQQLPGFAEGWWSVQDSSAQIAGELLPVADGMRVLDACAAPGGKTAHLLERADLQLLALDIDAQRLEFVETGLQRLGLDSDKVQYQAAAAQELDSWWSGEPFDAILADVPCTASGIVRRHPDIRWLRRDSDIAATAALQAAILESLWSTLKVGGHLLYVTCSLFPAEGQAQIDRFMARHTDATLLPQSPGQVLPAIDTPEQAGGDGFYYALLHKHV